METVTFRIDSTKGTIRIDRPLFLGATYGVTVDGYETDTPQIVFADCDGRPVAEVADGMLSLDTEELLAVFTAAGISGAPGVVTVHAWALNEAGSNIAAADIPVFYAPYFSAPSGTLTRIDAKGPKGDPGPKGDKGDKGDDGVCVPVSGWLAFEVDENSHLILHAATESDVYATTNGVIDHAKPRFTLGAVGDERHLLYHFYGDSTDFHYTLDLGNVRGAQGDPGEQGDPGQDGSTDASETLAGTALDTSTVGSLRAAVQTIGRALGATMTAIALCLSAGAQDVSLEELAGLAITNGVGVVTNVNLSGLQPRLPYPTNAIPAAAVTNAPWLSGEADPSVGMTNGTIYVKGASITPLTEHQSLAPVVDYVDAKTTEVGEVAAARVVNATNALMRDVKGLIPQGGGGTDGRGVEIPVYAYGGDWRLTVEDAGSTNAAAGTEKPTKDYISLLAETTGVYRHYKVEAEQEPIIIDKGASMPEVELTISDPHGCVDSFEDGVLSSSGVSGVVKVYGVDTTGVSRAVSITMTPVVPGKVITEMWAEDAVTERYIWNTNVFAKITSVSTNAADMVDYRWCRHMDNWSHGAPADGHRLIPRALSRFGSDGRLNDAEWTWGGEGADKARFTPSKVNRDFFWPELLPGLQCFSARVHETTAAGNNSQCYPWLAVAPHYVITAGHYSSAWWHGMRYVVQPYFCTDLVNERFMTASTDRMVGKVPQGDGVVADVMLVHVTSTIPSNCLARFATDETLERLSLSKFGKCAALTITSHQTIAPLCLNAAQSGNIFSWSGEPGASTLTVPYLDNSGAPGKAFALEHPTHMFDSGTPVFLASPSGKVVPLTHYCLSNGRTAHGPRFGDILASLSSMVQSDSGGTEDIQYWSFEDLATGVGTNSLEVVQ